jgi:hypothetical protein
MSPQARKAYDALLKALKKARAVVAPDQIELLREIDAAIREAEKH